MQVVVVATTLENRHDADVLATSVLEQRLAACAHVFPVESRYWWKGRIESASEVSLVFKTAVEKTDALLSWIRAQHPYDQPELIVTPVVGGDPGYLRWVQKETSEGEVSP